MKKIYYTPQLQIFNVEIDGSLLQNISTSDEEIDAAHAGLTKDEGGWSDIWE